MPYGAILGGFRVQLAPDGEIASYDRLVSAAMISATSVRAV
jgi:hypothetical protein